MSDPATTPQPQKPPPFSAESPHFQQTFELYRLRAEDFERSFYSFRGVEWQLAFQIYAGYAAVATGFFGLKSYKGLGMSGVTLAAWSLLALLLLFSVSWFCQLQIQRRLHFTRSMQNAYIRCLHEVLAPELAAPTGTMVPRFQKWWAFYPMQALNVATVAAVSASILYSTSLCT